MNETDEKFYFIMQSCLLKRRDLKPIDKQVWSYLDFRQGENETSWPGTEKISKDLGVSRPTVIGSIKRLVDTGDIKVVTKSKGGRREDGRPATNHYKTVQKSDSLTVKNLDSKREINCKEKAFNCQENPNQLSKKPKSTVKNLDTKTNIKTNTEKEQKNKTNSSFLISPELVKDLIKRHIALSPVVQPVKHRPGLLVKCKKLLAEYQAQDVRDTIERFSSTGKQGDGWGVILKMIPMIENIRAEETYQAKVEEHKKYKQPRSSGGKLKGVAVSDIVSEMITGKPRTTLSAQDRKLIFFWQSKMMKEGLNPPTIIEVEQELRKKQKTDNTV